jgi:hypothetical protein
MISIKALTENILSVLYKPHRTTAVYFGDIYCEDITRGVDEKLNGEADVT